MRTFTEAQKKVWDRAVTISASIEYAKTTRNADPAIRASFKTNREISGTRAWAIVRMMELPNMIQGDPKFSDAECAKILAAVE